MARGREPYVEELASTVKGLIAAGVTDPSDEEIAAKNFGGRALCAEIVRSVRDRLPRVRDVLVEDGYVVHLTSEIYYDRFRKAPPQTEAEARRCIPLGRGVKGLRRAGPDDLMWMVAEGQNVVSSTGKLDHAGERVKAASRAGYLSQKAVEKVLCAVRPSCARLFPEAAPQLALPLGISPEDHPVSIGQGYGAAVGADGDG